MKQFKWVLQYIGDKIWMYYLGIAMAVMSSILFILYPKITQDIVDNVLLGTTNAMGEVVHQVERLPFLLLLIVLAQVLRSCNQYGMILLMDKVSQDMIQRLRLDLYRKISDQGVGFYKKFNTGDLMTRLTADVDVIRHSIAWMSYNIVASFTMFAFSMAFFFSIHVQLTLVLLLLSPFVLGSSYFYCKTVYPYYQALREKLAGMNTVAQENITANKLVRAFSREEYEKEKFDQWNKGYRQENLNTNKQWIKFYPYVEGFSQGMVGLILVLGGLFIMEGNMTMGELAAFSLLSWGVSVPMKELGMYLNEIQNFQVSSAKVIEIYNEENTITSPEAGHKVEGSLTGDIQFSDVSFKHEDEPEKFALSHIDWTIKQGSTVAIMGPTGSGKTTLINTIVRLIDVTRGSVKIDGVDVRDWDLENLRSHIGVSTQEVLLYSDTIDANIAYGKPALTRNNISEFAQLAAAQFISRLALGMETVIGERGTGLSGGQKQRIALARSLATQPSVLILDDTTSAVDVKTEQYIQNSLKNLPFTCTKIIIGQRISSIQNADQIVVMDDGAIIGMGTHEELLKSNEYYSKICKLQNVEVSDDGTT